MKKSRIALCLLFALCICFFGGVAAKAENANPQKLQLSSEELQYFDAQKTLRVSLLKDWIPFSRVNKDGEFQGLPILILERLAAESGVALEVVPADNYSQSLEQLAEGRVDMLGMISEYPTEDGFNSTTAPPEIVPYLTTQTLLIQHKSTDLVSLPIATMADILGRTPVTRSSTVSVINYNTPQECLNAVRVGQADATICDSFTGAALMQQYAARDLIATPSTTVLHFGFGLPHNADYRLASALKKAVGSFSNSDINRVLISYGNYDSESFWDFVYRYPFEIICVFIALMFVVLIALLTYTKVNVSQHQALQGYEESYRLLSDTFGEAGMEYDYLADCLTVFGQQSHLDIDRKIENFKDKLKSKAVRLSLTPEQFDTIINEGVEGKSFVAEFQCGVKSGEWVWYRFIYTVICTSESHRRPIRLVGCLANIDEEHAEKERLMKLSSNDQLTGLLNHATADKLLHSLLEQEVDGRCGMLAILDIDYFKKFNDKMGHLCGDDVLRSLGAAIREIFTSEDILCRWGGDEFLFFLVEENNRTQNLTSRIDQLRKKMSNYEYLDKPCPVTLSIGGAKCYPGGSFDSLFQQADDALYLAKEHGRDQFWLYAPTEQTLEGDT
ncbi:MAG: GGDEF domain-containing protein [Oscillospiraceae bacterium]